ncbi:carbohydrate ABC transporter permease [Variovorax sp. CY25R-8]|jgi:multiple sugar transport system permease protein|uniref:carbohydrate ABC transporter permease n=1 Tax=Variovorax TaxID=34072 RepID=UPI0009E66E6D|nr:sugar ABC transporter permease [Variovorax sp. CY25R-8]MCT8179119.1 sugar ABC transporter permease [Variovorax sp. CY25R-8]
MNATLSSAAAVARREGARRRARLDGHPLAPYALVLPATLYLLVFQGYPLLRELVLSFTSTSLLAASQGEWVGLRNYADLWNDPDFHRVIFTTLLYTVACVASAIGLGLASALLLDAPFRGRGIARAAVTIPWAAPPVAVALIFIWIYNAQYGVFGHTLRFFGIAAGSENWLDSMQLAMPAVLLTTIWQIFPFASVVLLAALQGVPSELREAAVMDGADRLSVFKAVVWPTIRPSVALLALFSTIWSLRRFDLIWLLTQGGPVGATNTLVIDLYRRAFVNHHLGQAAAVGMVGVAIALAVTLVYFRYTARAEREGER